MYEEYYEFRQRLVDRLAGDVLGPGSAEETIDDAPLDRYITGILFPRNAGALQASATVDLEEDAATGEGDETDAPDPPVALSNVRYPSSMGLTFAVDPSISRTIQVAVRAARYESQEVTDPEPQRNEEGVYRGRRADRGPAGRWKRVPLEFPPIDLDATEPQSGNYLPLDAGLTLFVRVRVPNPSGKIAITLVLINNNTSQATGLRDPLCYFQPEVNVRPGTPNTSPFVARALDTPRGSDSDRRTYRLLYRYRAAIAIGHGCSVEWNLDSVDTTRANAVRTTFLPAYDLLLADSNPAIPNEGLSFRALAGGARALVIPALATLLDGYGLWIEDRGREVATLDPALRETAAEHLTTCTDALNRMRRGVVLLDQNPEVWRAFQLANEAMLQQRARTAWLRTPERPAEPDLAGDFRWRPFQLAFILLTLESIADERSEARSIVDLLWFPTGGGKTEAYLGLIAFCVFLRRLRRGQNGAGVTAIMRYTLRLLTIQQFERAALLVCCCEMVRRSRTDLGVSPISIGLWVGGKGTPNTLREARIALDRLRLNGELGPGQGNPVQLHACPWCGTGLTPRNYYIAERAPRLIIACRNQSCAFGHELPVYLVDQDVYAAGPTLLIATSDKFAGLPWRDESGSLFNLDSQGTPPPELIIQDELHLISGPLGSLAGLYEAAVDRMCSHNGNGPKVIASTATIRRADDQGAGLFGRAIRQFPPSGLDARDSYFAVQVDRDRRGSRLYVGVMTPATSQTTLLVRVYAALLQGAAVLAGSDSVKDPYWTLTGYFNSLRVLGGARLQVQDDVTKRMELLGYAEGRPQRLLENQIELTSREPSGNIPHHLRSMAVSYPSPGALDVILATNMISVGVDIDRLGLMAVMGQPQSTSEYIQATSRVGRQFPGLVVVIFNAARSRDRSHYESFVDYHSALYRQVEATSVTPFSARARDRALHAVLISLARLMVPELRSNEGAGRVSEVRDKLTPIVEEICTRVSRICGLLRVDASPEVDTARRQLLEIIAGWEQRAARTPNLVFHNHSHPDLALLVDAARADEAPDLALPTLWSLRDVDLSSNLYQVQR